MVSEGRVLRALQEDPHTSFLHGHAHEAAHFWWRLPADAPALAVVPFRNDGPGYTIRYHKGALMLDAFRIRLGDDAFLRACRRFYEKIEGRSAGTPDFRAHWQEALGDEQLLSSWLDSPGSAPVPPAE